MRHARPLTGDANPSFDTVRAILRERIRPAARAPAAPRRLRLVIVLWLVLVAIFVAFFQLTDP